MAAKKKYYKKKLEEKKIEILKTIIEEEIDLFAEEVQSHGLARFTDRGTFTGLLLSPLTDIKNAFLHAGAKAAVQLAGMAGLLIGGTIAGLLPFNDPKTVNYIAKKIQYLEQENLKIIDKQFEKELGQMRDGWETFKTDFWGIGFVYSPMSAIAAIATAEKGLDMGLSVLNVVSGGKVGQVIDKMNEDVKDPGSLKEYLGKAEQSDQKKAQERVESQIESERCFNNLTQAGFLDPTCIGADQRERFPSTPAGTAAYIKFIERNIQNYNDNRRERFEVQFPNKEYQGAFQKSRYSGVDRAGLSKWLKANGFLTENKEEEKDNIILEEGIFQTVKQAITGQRPQTGIPSLNELHQKIDGWIKQGQIKPDEAKEFFRILKNNTLQSQEIKQEADKWSAANVSKMMTNIFTGINNDIATGKAGNISSQEIETYKGKAEAMVDKIFDAVAKKTKKFKIIPNQAAKQAAKQAVKNSMTKIPKKTSTQAIPQAPTAQPQQNALQTRPAIQPTQVQPEQRPAVPAPVAPQAFPRR